MHTTNISMKLRNHIIPLIFFTNIIHFQIPLRSAVPKMLEIADNTGFRPIYNQAKANQARLLIHH